MNATYILKSNCIFDSISDVPRSGGVVVKGKKIVGVFPQEELSRYTGEDTQVIDYGQKTLLPGFIDSHTHTGNFMEMADPEFCVDVSGSKTFSQVMDKIRIFGEKHKDALL